LGKTFRKSKNQQQGKNRFESDMFHLRGFLNRKKSDAM
jgi:hypothetical protein